MKRRSSVMRNYWCSVCTRYLSISQAPHLDSRWDFCFLTALFHQAVHRRDPCGSKLLPNDLLEQPLLYLSPLSAIRKIKYRLFFSSTIEAWTLHSFHPEWKSSLIDITFFSSFFWVCQQVRVLWSRLKISNSALSPMTLWTDWSVFDGVSNTDCDPLMFLCQVDIYGFR